MPTGQTSPKKSFALRATSPSFQQSSYSLIADESSISSFKNYCAKLTPLAARPRKLPRPSWFWRRKP
ncbi:MAG: hypothetical protein CK541_04720, partial [Opitutia bacterium]